MDQQAHYLETCRQLIEKQLGWGDTAQWQNQDFENLSEAIFAATQTLLSASTLKRIWGKTRYDSKPAMNTLNALAQFCGHANWRSFTAHTDLQDKQLPPDRLAVPVNNTNIKKWWLIAATIIAVIVACLVLYTKTSARLHYSQLSFSNKPVTTGLPNTVIFEYDATHSNADSVFIQQSWDKRRRFRVDKQLHAYTSTYYLPGYYRAKLILDDSIVKEQDVYIESVGWTGLIENSSIPVYLPKEHFTKGLPMAITEKDLSDQHIDTEKELPTVSITRVDKSIDIPGDHLSMLAVLQNTSISSKGVCRQSSITLMGTEGLINIPLCTKGCVGEIGLMIGMKYTSGKTNDLSGFGVDFSQPATVDCRTSNQTISISVNNRLAYQGNTMTSIGRVVGVKFSFKGTGTVSRFELKQSNL